MGDFFGEASEKGQLFFQRLQFILVPAAPAVPCCTCWHLNYGHFVHSNLIRRSRILIEQADTQLGIKAVS